jgi:hypothetical protein
MRFLLFLFILVAACIPMLAGAKRLRPCYKGCHGCGKCMRTFREEQDSSGRSGENR